MLVNVKKSKQLTRLHKKTGKTIDVLVNEILSIYLNKENRNDFIKQELSKLFERYYQRKIKTKK